MPQFLSVMRARLHFVNREQSMAASGLYDGPLFTPAATVVWRPSCTLQTWPEQYLLTDVTAHVRELCLAKRRQLNFITCLSTWTVNTSCSVYTLAGSQRLTRRPWNDELRSTLYERTYGYKGLLKECFPVQLHDTRLRVSWRVTPSTQHAASGFNGSRPTTAFRPRSSSVFRPPSSGFHLASPTSYRTVACYVFVCCCAFMFSFHSLDNSHSLYIVVHLALILILSNCMPVSYTHLTLPTKRIV